MQHFSSGTKWVWSNASTNGRDFVAISDVLCSLETILSFVRTAFSSEYDAYIQTSQSGYQSRVPKRHTAQGEVAIDEEGACIYATRYIGAHSAQRGELCLRIRSHVMME